MVRAAIECSQQIWFVTGLSIGDHHQYYCTVRAKCDIASAYSIYIFFLSLNSGYKVILIKQLRCDEKYHSLLNTLSDL